MAASGLLGQWYIETVLKGGDPTKQEIIKIRNMLESFDARKKRMDTEEVTRKKKLTDEDKKRGAAIRGVTAGTITAAGAIYGLARAGYAGSVQGQALQVRFEQLSREIAATLLPYTDKLTQFLGDLIERMRLLDGAGQELIGTMIGLGVAIKIALSGHPILALITAVGTLLIGTKEGRDILRSMESIGQDLLRLFGPLLQSALVSLMESFRILATIISTITDGIRTITNLIPSVTIGGGPEAGGRDLGQDAMTILTRGGLATMQGLVRGITSLIRGEGIEASMAQFMGDEQRASIRAGITRNVTGAGGGAGRGQILPAGSGFEAVADSFRRLQMAAIREDLPRLTLQVQRDQLRELQGIAVALVGFPGAFRPQPQLVIP